MNTLVSTYPGAHQRPQREGSANRPIFGGQFPRQQQTFAVRAVDSTGQRVEIDAGIANGATTGSVYRL